MRPRRSIIPFLVLLASVVFVGGPPAPAVGASGAPRLTNNAASRGKQTGAVRPEAAPLVTGSPVHLQSVVAGSPPTAIIAISPKNPPGGLPAYPAGTTVVGNTLTADSGGFRAFFNVTIKDWDPNGDGSPGMHALTVKVDATGYLGLNAAPSNVGVDLVPPASIPCTTNANCVALFGESWAQCTLGFCKAGYVDVAGFLAPANNYCNFAGSGGCASGGSDTSSNFYRWYFIHNLDNRPDGHILYYVGSLVLDIPAGAKGKYTVSWVPEETYFADVNGGQLDTKEENGFVVSIRCTTSANCNDSNPCTTDVCNADGTCSNTKNYNAATHCCNPANGNLTLLSDGIQCTDDVCDAANGQVTHPNSQVNTSCGNAQNSQCDKPDSCDGAGHCLARLEPALTPCGSSTNTECNGADTCDGAGACVTNIRPAGTPCGDPSDTACDNPDTCNGLGTCVRNTEPDGLACSDALFCTVGERCNTAVCTGGTPRDCADLLTCTTDSCNEGAGRCDHILQAGKCLIDGVCYFAGDLRPGNTCEECNPTLSGTSWSVRPDGSLCNDGNACTGTGRPGIGFDTCTGGVCTGLVDIQCNDQCEFAVPVIVGVNTSNNSSAGTDDGEASCQPDSNHDVWFKFTAGCNGITFASTTGSALAPSNDTVLSVYNRCPLNGGTELACDDDSGVALQSALTFATTTGTTYVIRVAGFEDNKGPIVLNIRPVDDCLIDGVCYGAGDHNPANDCQACIPEISSTQWSPRAEGSACGNHADTECDSPDACDGAGICEVNFKPDGILCSDEVPADVCTKNFCQTGLCTHPPEPAGLPCGDPSDTECDNPDTCDGGGGCAPNLEGAGHACGDPSDSQCDHPDTCDGGGGCLDNLAADQTTCDDVEVPGTDNGECADGFCVFPPVIVWNSDPLTPDRTTRSLRFKVTPHAVAPAAPGENAIRVELVELGHPNPRNAVATVALPTQTVPQNFSKFDTNINGVCSGAGSSPNYNGHPCGTNANCVCNTLSCAFNDAAHNGVCIGNPLPPLVACTATGETVPPNASGQGGCARWVGRPATFLEAQEVPTLGHYRAARLQCTPFYFDWVTETAGKVCAGPLGPTNTGLPCVDNSNCTAPATCIDKKITVVGAEILPSSTYSAQTYGASCRGREGSCTYVSAPVIMFTRRYGDVAPVFTPPDVGQPGAIDVSEILRAFGKLGPLRKAGAKITPNLPEENLDVDGADVGRVVDAVRGYAYPLIESGPCPCPSTVICGPGVGSTPCGCDAGPACAACGGGQCVNTCTGGVNDGLACRDNDPVHNHCPGGTCGSGFCRDKCARCTP